MSDTVTILGNVASDPLRNTTGRGDAVIRFRLASPHRWLDRSTGAWVDGETNWYDVSAFRQLAENVRSSLHSGDPVIVTGRLKVRKWEANGKSGTSVEIEADAIGHNLRHGASAFVKPHRAQAPDPAERLAPPSDEDAPDPGAAADAWSVPAEDPSEQPTEETTASYAELLPT
ncbi:single-stranded DNA-binding protein [Microbacterium bovistercoris]|uniref:Single-stranded DNA-binding protein n=1 Tax=Microbacterium bovistercoris TaxID=2293570 RepID=A0A371NRB4_9MICO|nr:single-stranded DNA-binding protein [Microbacterium bovistercoris]REJ04734.1 single-stranded DNA-binding protein [Microbacterium bovistercoris]